MAIFVYIVHYPFNMMSMDVMQPGDDVYSTYFVRYSRKRKQTEQYEA